MNKESPSGRVTAREALVVVVGFVGLSLAMTWPLALHASDQLPSDAIDPLLNTWLLAWGADRLPHGLRGWWSAPFLFPAHDTLAYSEHLLGIVIFTAPLQWLTANPVLAYNVAFVASYVVAGTGLYWLTRSFGIDRAAALVASLTFACVPYRLAQVSHVQVLMSGWMAFSLLGLHRYLRSGSLWALAGFAAGFLATGLSNSYFLYFFSVPVVVIVGVALVRARGRRTRLVRQLAFTAALLAVVLAPIIAGYHRVRVEQGLARSREAIDMFGARPASYLHRPLRARLWDGVLDVGAAERELFPGATALALAGVGLIDGAMRRRRADRHGPSGRLPLWTYAAIVGVSVWLSFGTGHDLDPRFRWAAGWPYRTLLAVVPGLDGLRVPARMFSVVSLALSVLAGAGAAILIRGSSSFARATVAAALSTMIVLEGYGGPMPLAAAEMPAMTQTTSLYEWLRRQPPGAVLELPIGNTNPITLQYQMKVLVHRHPIVNGYSGWQTPLQKFLAGDASPLFEPDHVDDLLEALREIGVRYVIVHAGAYDDRNDASTVLRGLRGAKSVAGTERSFGDVSAFTLAGFDAVALQDAPARRLPNARFRATASEQQDRLWMALDGDLETRWLSGRPQRGTEWIQLEFDRRRDIARVEISVADRSLGDYPRRIVLEGSDGEQPMKTLFVGAPIVSIIRTLAAPRGHPLISIPLPPGSVRLLRLRQTGHTSSWYWSVDEMTVFERAEDDLRVDTRTAH